MRSVIRLARSLGLRVIAEGVETEQQLAELVALECDWAQGFYFSRPVEPGTFTALLETRAPRV